MSSGWHRTAALGGLLARYRATFRHHWRLRKESATPILQAQEAQFMPAALSLQSQPVSPVGRWVARVLIALLTVLLVWACVGKLDIVVNAGGRIIPSARTKTIASLEVARVRALHVQEGQAVRAGQALIELDTRMSESEHDRAEAELQSAALQAARARSLLAALENRQPPQLAPVPNAPRERWLAARAHVRDQWQDYLARYQLLAGEIERYNATLPLATRRAADYQSLMQTGYVSPHAWMEKEEARLDLAGKLRDAGNQQAALTAETRKNAQDALNEALRIMDTVEQDRRRAAVHGELLKLSAPVDGTVQQLSAHTVGGVVPAAQALMQIVPNQGPVEMEAFMENRDVGFVREGQPAEVKIDAFDYTRYGTVAARVSHVSRDAISDEKRGLIYSVKVMLEQPTMRVDGRDLALTPGMSGSVEIRTGSRRAIEYVLSPLIQHGHESLRER